MMNLINSIEIVKMDILFLKIFSIRTPFILPVPLAEMILDPSGNS